VIDNFNKPVVNATVSIYYYSSDIFMDAESILTDNNGCFEVFDEIVVF